MTSKAFANATDANRQQGGRRNLIINGAMQVAQRGTSSGSITSNGYSSLDRWYINASGGTYALSQQTFTVGQTDVPNFPKNYLRLAVSTGDNNLGLHQRVEDVETLGGKTVTLSFWAKGTNPDGGKFVSSWIQDFGSGGSASVEAEAEGNIVLTSSWQKFTITFNVPSISGKTVGAGSFTWVEILRQPATDTGTGSWTADIAQVQLEVGDTATPFEHRSYGEELALCQRYYQKSYPKNEFAGDNTGSGVVVFIPTGSSDNFNVNLPVLLRAAPTVVIYRKNGGATDQAQRADNSASYIGLTTAGQSDRGFIVTPDSSSTRSFKFHYLVDAEL